MGTILALIQQPQQEKIGATGLEDARTPSLHPRLITQ